MVMLKVMNTMYHVPLFKCELINQLIFFFKTFLVIWINFQWQKWLKIHYFLHLRFKHFQITFIKSYSMNVFQQHREFAQIPLYFIFPCYLCSITLITSTNIYSSRMILEPYQEEYLKCIIQNVHCWCFQSCKTLEYFFQCTWRTYDQIKFVLNKSAFKIFLK
jgi:hypothetical protein